MSDINSLTHDQLKDEFQFQSELIGVLQQRLGQKEAENAHLTTLNTRYVRALSVVQQQLAETNAQAAHAPVILRPQ